jgi:hypothetical protein
MDKQEMEETVIVLKNSANLSKIIREKKMSDSIQAQITLILGEELKKERELYPQAILAVTDIIKKATSEEQVMQMLKEKYPQYS